MRYRCVFTLLILFGCSPLYAATTKADWDCQRTNDGKEWICTAKKKQPDPKAQEPGEPSTVIVQPAPPVPEAPLLQKPQPALSKSEQPGWTCVVDSQGSGWDCTLVGPDPKGQARIVGDTIPESGIFSEFTVADAEIYKNMLGKISQDPWALCTSLLGPAVSPDLGAARDQAPIDIDSDYTDIFEEEILTLTGNVEFSRADQKIWSDQAHYDLQSQTLDARGNVYYQDSGLSLFSDSAFMKLASDEAHLINSRYILHDIPARGRSKVTYQDGKNLYRFKDVSYTTCRPSNQDWALHADHLKVDRESGRGQALNAWLKVRGVPVFYTPYISFPIDDRRKSGFLAPTFGSTDETGFDFTVPYYWNIAPNFDMTFFPRGMSKRGVMLGTELRYLTEASNTEFSVELVPYDSIRGEARGQVSLINNTRFSPNLRFDMDGNYVSDDEYLDELGDTLSVSDNRHVRSQANLRYDIGNTSMLARLEHYQTIDPTIASDDRPYRRLPQLLLNMKEPIGPTDAEFLLDSEFVYFDRGDSVTGQRLDIKPGLRYILETPSTFLTPSLSLEHTQYWLDDPADQFSGSVQRTIPIASVDSGIFLERDFSLGGKDYLQTLEPRLFYLYIPDDNQDDIPIFDTSDFDFTFNQLFRENRFNGVDRIGDANQLSLALTSRFIDSETGRQRLRTSLGQIYHFQDRKVTLNPTDDPDTTSTSNLIAELDAMIIDGLTFRSSLQWNPDNSDIERGQASFQYRDGFSRIVNLSYRYRKDPDTKLKIIDQGDISFRWPIADEIHAIGRWQYSFLDNLTLESFLGFEKESCCWRFRVLGRYYVNDVSSEPQTGIFVQLELKGFTSFGDKVDRFLERNISGFRIPEE